MKIGASDMVENVANRIAPPADGLVVDVTSDLICPWCFVAKRRLEKASSILGKTLEVRWHPFQLNPEMPVEGLDRRLYRSAKFGSWEQSQRLDAQVSVAGAEVGIRFRHDLMKRTPNTFKGHVLLAAALKESLQTQNLVAERLFQAYFLNGEDVGDPTTLLGIAREFGVTTILRVEDLDRPALVSEVKTAERKAASAGVRGGSSDLVSRDDRCQRCPQRRAARELHTADSGNDWQMRERRLHG